MSPVPWVKITDFFRQLFIVFSCSRSIARKYSFLSDAAPRHWPQFIPIDRWPLACFRYRKGFLGSVVPRVTHELQESTAKPYVFRRIHVYVSTCLPSAHTHARYHTLCKQIAFQYGSCGVRETAALPRHYGIRSDLVRTVFISSVFRRDVV